jgi:hypothetical protein
MSIFREWFWEQLGILIGESWIDCLVAHLFTVQYLFDSLKEVTVLRCGHTMHQDCAREMHTHAQWVHNFR